MKTPKSPNLIPFFTAIALLPVPKFTDGDNGSLFIAFQLQSLSIHPSHLQKLRWECLAIMNSTEDGLSRKQSAKMTELMDLPLELLSVIITFLAMTSDGGRDLVRASATCKVLLILARRPDILRVVTCQKTMLRGFCEPHHHIDGLLSRCVRAGNPAAENILAMAVLRGRTQLWTKIKVSELNQRTIESATGVSLVDRRSIAESYKTGSIADLPHILFCMEDMRHICESYRRVGPLRLLRIFISRASSTQLFTFCRILEEFIVFFVGYDMARESGIVATVDGMCSYRNFVPEEASVRLPPSFRKKLLVGFDHLFLPGGELVPTRM